jgi:hypothetical protein
VHLKVTGQLFGSSSSSDSTSGMDKNGLFSVMSQLPRAIQSNDVFGPYARSYIASRLRRFTIEMRPKKGDTESKSRYNFSTRMHRSLLDKAMLGKVPLVPADSPTQKWIPGELIASQVTKMQLRLIDESQYGPLKSVTMFPSVMSAILVFEKPYNPERLAEVLKINFGVESEPNGIIQAARRR